MTLETKNSKYSVPLFEKEGLGENTATLNFN